MVLTTDRSRRMPRLYSTKLWWIQLGTALGAYEQVTVRRHHSFTPFIFHKGEPPNATLQAPPEAGATQERSNCLDCQGGLCLLRVRPLLHLPGPVMFDHGV